MKITKTLFACALAGLLFVSCKETASAPETAASGQETASAAAPAKLETASFNIDGMSCEMSCAKAIENKLTKLDGVEKASVDFEKKTATVSFDASKQSAEKIVETVESVADGKTYKVSDVKSSGDQAMVLNKDKKKKKKKDTTTTTTAEGKGCGTATTEGKKTGGCCAAKKSCSEPKTL